jgi:hypothetical protein
MFVKNTMSLFDEMIIKDKNVYSLIGGSAEAVKIWKRDFEVMLKVITLLAHYKYLTLPFLEHVLFNFGKPNYTKYSYFFCKQSAISKVNYNIDSLNTIKSFSW